MWRDDFKPLTVAAVDLRRGLEAFEALQPVNGRDLFVVLWWGDIPLGHMELQPDQLGRPATLADAVATTVARAVGDQLFESWFQEWPPGPRASTPRQVPDLDALLSPAGALARLSATDDARGDTATLPSVSVVVCTRDRPEQLARCLESLRGLRIAPHEIVVVDNAPGSGRTRPVVEAVPGARYLAEPRPGLSVARNAGMAATTGEIIAFTDDDTAVHPDWTRRLAREFDDPALGCVTGLVLPAELDSRAQVIFEKGMGGFSQGYRRIDFDPGFLKRTAGRGSPVWKIGAGANMAVRRRALAQIGVFDERLGAGAAGCSEDSELWYRLLAHGWSCRYQPTAVVHHYHRRDVPGLLRQARDYQRGHVGALFVQFSRHRHWGNLRRALVDMPVWLVRRTVTEQVLGLRPRPGTWRASVKGYLRGLALFRLVLPEPRGKARRRTFLNRNPYPNAWSEGLFFREKMRAIHAVAPEASFERILEVGGGQSGLTRMLYPRATVTNIDLELDYAQSHLNQHPRMQFLAADATRLPFADASFDAATLFDVLEHIPDDEAAAAEVRRVVRPGGYLLVTSPNDNWRFPYYRALQPLCPSDTEIMAEWGHVRRGYALPELEKLLQDRPAATADFITPLTVLGHDLAFSRFGPRRRRLICAALSPLTWFGYLVGSSSWRGTETASSWRRGA